jgi:hypothetical protein
MDEGIRVNKFIFAGKEKLIISKKDEKFSEYENIYLERFNSISKIIKNIDIELTPNSRIAVKDGMFLSYIFNPINFYILKEFSKEFKNNKLMINILSSVLHLCRLTDLGSQSQFPYWVPKKDILERNILLLILKKINEIAKHKKTNTLNLKLIKNFNQINKSEKNIIIINKPSQLVNEEEIPVKSIDLVITDPPYFDQVAYSEYLKIWEYFCDYKSNFKDEIILSNRKYEPSSEEKYIENLTKCFSVVSRKMKDDGLAIIFFKDSKPKNIHLFLKVMEESGLQFLRSIHVGNKNFTYKQNTTQETTVTGECLFFFIKNTTIKNIKNKKIVFDRLLIKEKIEEVVKDFTFEYLRKNKNGTLGELYDNGLLLTLYNNDLLQEINKSKDIVDILNKNFILFEDRNYRIE